MTDALHKVAAAESSEKTEAHKGSPWLRELYELFAPTREYIRASGITQEELHADIDAAIAEVRAAQRDRAEQAKRADSRFPD
jgi:DNA-binding protein H-NS